MKRFLLVVSVLSLTMSLTAQDFHIRIKRAFDSIYNTAGGDGWHFKTLQELENRKSAPYVVTSKVHPKCEDYPDQIGKRSIKILDLRNNNMSGVMSKGFFADENLTTKTMWYMNNACEMLFSHNKITHVNGDYVGWVWKGRAYLGKLKLDNNMLTSFTSKSSDRASLFIGSKVFTFHQNDISGMMASDLDYRKSNNCIIANNADTVRFDNNRLNFRSLISLVDEVKYITRFVHSHAQGNPDLVFDYYPQKPLGGDYTEDVMDKGASKTLSFSLDHPENVYSWQLNGKDVPLTTFKEYTFSVDEEHAGVYRCKITNPRLPDVTLYSYDMAVFMQKDGNKTAEDISFTHSAITKNYPENAVIGSFQATDPDGDELFYRLPDRTADNSHFRIVNGKTLVSAETLFDVNYIEKYTIVVEAYDVYGGKFQKEFVINRGEGGSTPLPSDITLSANSVDENIADKYIGDIAAVGVESSHGYTFELPSGMLNNNMFKIDGSKLTTAVKLDYERQSELSVRVMAKAADGTSLQKDFVVNVIDKNDAPHDIVLTETELKVNTKSGTIIGYIFASDQDPADKSFVYKLTDDAADNSHFVILDNTLRVRTKFTETTTKTIAITATDSKGAGLRKEFDITVKSDEAEDNRPPRGIGITNSVISHNLDAGAKIADIYMSDPDGDAGTFSCDNSYVVVEGSVLKLKTKPDSNSPFDITIKGSDGVNEIEQTLKIYVTKQEGSTEVITVQGAEVKVYPNPANSTIYVEGLDNARYTISDINGVVVKTTYQRAINISNLKSGYYILRIESNGAVITKQIVKK
jgi:hypothetical protein